MPFTFFGLLRKSWKILNSPCPVVAPNAGGSRSERSKRESFALTRACADARVSASLYALSGTFLFSDVKPPRFAQIVDASGDARYVMNARAPGLSLNMTTVSPPVTTAGGEPLIDGKANML